MIPPALKNIHELPLSVQTLMADYTGKLLEDLGDNVLAVLVYGSAAGINYIPGISNVNIAVILKDLDFRALKQSLAAVRWARRHKMAAPLYLSKEYILNSLDVFPLEFSEIKQQNIVVFGEDIFTDLDIPVKDVRLLCEQQVKGKLLHLRQAYLTLEANAAALKSVLAAALTDLVPVFRQLIILKAQEPLEQKDKMLEQFAGIFSLDHAPFVAVYQDKSKKNLISPNQLEAHYQNFLNQLEVLSRHLDSL